MGTRLRLAVEVEEVEAASATLRLWVDGEGERLVGMERDEADPTLHVAAVPCPTPCLLWYNFIVEADGETWHLGAQEGSFGGEGEARREPCPPSFQVTVYVPREVPPAWYTRGVVYQIFPDRYRRGPDWRARAEEALDASRAHLPRRLVEDWDAPPAYERDEDGAVTRWDFHGGTLAGIREDLPRLADLGVTALYLNPIFQAASNHRYDVGDYTRVDPLLGDEEEFRALCAEAEERGIGVILDGVFNHVGSDSRYFDRHGTYGGTGAWENPTSPWHDAFEFHDDGGYACWWGVEDLPAFRKDAPQVRRLLLGEQGVVRRWMRAGARGWRLDVADELTDELIEQIRAEALAERPDGVVLGEVWEDASNKTSYGRLRRYLLGSELDGAMNYPFRAAVLGFVLGRDDAGACAEALETLRENYPPQALAASLNLLGSHDRPRVLSVLAQPGGPGADVDAVEEDPTSDALSLAKARLWLALLLQMASPGVPGIYYGDEAGLQGGADPGNRGAYPWGHEDPDALAMTRHACGLRRALPVLVDGQARYAAPDPDVLCVVREDREKGQAVLVAVNRSPHERRVVRLPLPTSACGSNAALTARDLMSGQDVEGEDGLATLELAPLGSAVLHVCRPVRLQRPLGGGLGVLCHVTSLPTRDGTPGHLGAPAFAFVDALAAAGARFWQVLPVTVPDGHSSPYAGPSAFAGDVALLGKGEEQLQEELENAGKEELDAFFSWRASQATWLDDWCAFAARGDEELCAWGQYRFQVAWDELRAYAHERGVQIIGDLPFTVAAASADVAAHPELFSVDERGEVAEEAGCPPDRFADEGQRWGCPTFRWDVMRRDGYAWWVARLERALQLYDYVRLDHFLGYQDYYGIRAGQDPSCGTWHAGPGIDLFRRACERLGPLPVVAEDLGVVTPGARALAAEAGFPGMDVVQFADHDVRAGLRPSPSKLVYTSTHDTSTLVGWCTDAFAAGDEEEGRGIARKLMREALACDAPAVVVSLQDAALLGDEARMNVPGTTSPSNWSWQATEEDLRRAVRTLRELQDGGHATRRPLPTQTAAMFAARENRADLTSGQELQQAALDYLDRHGDALGQAIHGD